MSLKPYSKARNTAFRLHVTMLYGEESGLPYISYIRRDANEVRLSIRSHPASLAMNITVWRMKQHLQWLKEIGLVKDISVAPGVIRLTLILPKGCQNG